MSDLADRVLTSPSGMTRAIARMQHEGLVDREQDPDDLRSFIVSLRPEGLRRLREAQVTLTTPACARCSSAGSRATTSSASLRSTIMRCPEPSTRPCGPLPQASAEQHSGSQTPRIAIARMRGLLAAAS